MRGHSALVLFSGGQDSTVCLGWALENFRTVETIGFSYGQRHAIELECRKDILAHLPRKWDQYRGRDHVLDVPVMGEISRSALTKPAEFALAASGFPNTFIPGRNLLFFTLAAAVAYRRNIDNLIGGMCETDYSGYPDCRNDTIMSMQTTLNLGMKAKFKIHTPLMWQTKAQTWQMAEELGILELVRERTHTCYMGVRIMREWGSGCGSCPACQLRKKGYEVFRGPTPAV